ncbi:aminopeptidase N [Thalassotalea mangrovi]|uniref:Aminopeptidase N n=1 Tax=Thalassotalea mangrovi TaxID=2572245 RepID=A0A4U1B7E6_9GAMM|nr:aminopeptidase N [Thalassotalea mangrovi]TKB45870.1 aminopeptidase N [Thalassotalea mangrovi]
MTDFTPRFLKDYQPAPYQIHTVDLYIELDDERTLVRNQMQIKRHGDADENEPLVLDGQHMELQGLWLNGEALNASRYQCDEQSLTITHCPQAFTLTIETLVNPKANTALEGIYKSGGAFCTQCEAEGFRRISYFLDRPDVMAIYTTTIVADKDKYPYLLANGNCIERRDLERGRHLVTWHDPFQKPCYLFALVAGDFDLLEDRFVTQSGREVALQLFVDKGNLDKARFAMQALQDSMAWDERVFGLEYDLDIYMIVAVDFFNMGAMENKGLNIFNSKFVLADQRSATDDDFFNVQAVIGHEYFHNWTGNRITCRDWFQLSLKEGLTVFRDQQFSADMHQPDVTRISNVRLLRAQQFAEDAGPMAHPIRPEKVVEMNNFYTLTVYEKGAEVIRMLHTLLGEQGFQRGMKEYIARHDGQAVTCDDFIAAMAAANDTDLQQFSLWYSQVGTPQVEATSNYDANSGSLTLTVEQRPASGQQHPPLLIPIGYELLAQDSKKVMHKGVLSLTQTTQQFTFEQLNEQPVVVLLTGFSAPVKLHFSQCEDELMTIMVHADDGFSRWEATQILFRQCIAHYYQDESFSLADSLSRAFADILDAEVEPAFKALQITLPGFAEMTEFLQDVEPQQLLNALSRFKLDLLGKQQAKLQAMYQACDQKLQSGEGHGAGYRALKNACLEYLVQGQSFDTEVTAQYQKASNMTEKIAALQVAASENLPCFEALNRDFFAQWQDDSLVMDKWFSIQARIEDDAVFERLEGLLNHPKFSMRNPNRARALIGSFAVHNPKYFHHASGRGYDWLTDQIVKLDAINPQVASRLITPLIQTQGFASSVQETMRKRLQRLQQLDDISADIGEKINAALVN